jgi:hypothetical protein
MDYRTFRFVPLRIDGDPLKNVLPLTDFQYQPLIDVAPAEAEHWLLTGINALRAATGVPPFSVEDFWIVLFALINKKRQELGMEPIDAADPERRRCELAVLLSLVACVCGAVYIPSNAGEAVN